MSTEMLYSRITELVLKSMENRITPEEFAELDSYIAASRENAKYFMECITTYMAISDLHATESCKRSCFSDSSFDQRLWKELSEAELSAPAITLDKPQAKPQLLEKVVYPSREKRQISKFNIFVLLNAAAVLLIVLFAQWVAPLPGVQVATLTESINAKWADAEKIETGQRFATGSTNILLREGCAELVFDNDARIMLEAPVEFQILTGDQIKLNYGRVYATIPEQAYGFTVSIPNGKIIDLGTEFGIQRDPFGNTELHVIKGRTTLIANTQGNRINMNVAEGDARKLSALTGDVETIALQKNLFVRKIDSQSNLLWKGQDFIDLADVVGGGKGLLEGRMVGSIDPATGDIHSKVVQQNGRTGGDSYNAVPESQFVDGAFVPNGIHGPGIVTSAGHRFEFPKTSGMYFSDISSNPTVLWMYRNPNQPLYLNRNGAESPASLPLIFLHPNAGITFDLNKIRQSLPNLEVDRFTATCGVSKGLEDIYSKTSNNIYRSEFWVLVDGVCVFHQVFDKNHSEVMKLDIPIAPEQKFLTLATTDGGDEYGLDWCIFEQPKLHLANSQ